MIACFNLKFGHHLFIQDSTISLTQSKLAAIKLKAVHIKPDDLLREDETEDGKTVRS